MKRLAKLIPIVLLVFFVLGVRNIHASVLINQTGTGSTFSPTSGGSYTGIRFSNSSSTSISVAQNSTWGSVNLLNGSSYYIQVPIANISGITCENLGVILYHNGSGASDYTGGTTSGSMCNWILTATLSDTLSEVSFFANGTGDIFTMLGNSDGSYGSFDVLSTTFIQHGTPAFTLSDSGFPPTSTTTRIESILPENGSITSSTSVDVSFDYYVNSSEFNDIQGLKITLTQIDGVGSQEYEFNPITLDSLESVSHNFTLPTNTIWELNFYLERDPAFFINEFQLLYNSRFSVETDPTVEIVECDITAIAGCIQKVILFLFRPSDASLHVFVNLYNQIKTKPPFGYGFAIQEELTNIDLTSDPAYEIPTFTPLMDIIFTPFRTALVWLFWFIFLFALFKRFSHIEL